MSKYQDLFRASLTAAAFALGATLPAQLDGKIVAQLNQLLATPTASAEAVDLRDQIWRSCAIKHGELKPLIDDLAARLKNKPAHPLELRLIRLSAHYLRRLGDVTRANRMLGRIQEKEETIHDTLNKAEVLDALGRNKQAIATYDRLLKKQIEPTLRNKILLRKALMASTAKADPTTPRGRRPTPRARPAKDKDKDKDNEKKPSALARFAAEPDRSTELKNHAAVILALTNEQKEAIKLFQAAGESTARFRQEVRLAEWAIEASDWPKAQEFAWNAVRNAKLKRDRRYALTILVEAYRRERKLDALVERFQNTKELDAQSREVWIDILRETGKVEKALSLFRTAVKGEFSTAMRRELLEICRETNQDQVLEQAYQKLITEEPRFLEWREGLARFYLERGRRKDALNVWRPYLQVTDDNRYRMAAAATLMGLGLDNLAVRFARACMAGADRSIKQSALLFLFDLHRERGRHADARKALEELDGLAPAEAGVRKEMADAYARLGDKKKSVAVLAGLYETLGDSTTPDTRMKLALMLSEIGEEEKALTHWVSLWRQINSIPRRRYVEERLMAVASRLGTLAKVAIDLEKKLVAGTADDREAGLLVRLYIKVNDPVSATEIIEEHMRRSGKKPVEVLTEKARVFQSCDDYYNYEQVVKELIKIDPEGRPDYLRQLAMSNMERGQRKEAREILERLKHEQTDTVSDEFEAGVLALAGMRKEALCSYRRGIAKYPERIDTYLLLSNIQRELNRHDRSAGMFQYLAATAEKDDLFTIAVDGILNMRDGRANRGAPNRLVEWTRRVVLERVARRPNKLYLYRLVADLSEELKDKGMAVRALKAALPIAGEQRTQILRELMAMVKPARNRMMGGMRILSSGVVVPMGQTPEQTTPVNTDQLMFGRRILGQAELVPPEVYLELGESFLNAAEVGNAQKTFNQASQLPEFAEMRRKFALAFELAGYPKEALRVYEQILSVENGDLGLIIKVGELQEQTGRDPVAVGLYQRGLELVLNRSVFARTGVRKDKKPEPTNPYFYMPGNRNTDEYDRHYSWLLSGLLATLEDQDAEQFLVDQRKKVEADLDRVVAERKAGKLRKEGALRDHPRLERRAKLCRRMAVAFGRIQDADEMDRRLLAVFPTDDKLLEQQVRFRLTWGYVVAARKLIHQSGRPEAECKKLRLLAGGSGSVAMPGRISIPEASGLLLPLLTEGKQDTAKALLERLDLNTGDKAALEQMSLLVGCSIYLREPDLTLMLCRHWLNLAVRHQPGLMYGVTESILRQGRMGLDKSQLRSLTEHLLEKVVAKPDKFTAFIQRLPKLRETAGADFLDREQIEKLIRSRLEASDRYIYGLEQLFALLAPEDRPPVLRSVWERLPKTQTAYFLLRFVTILDKDVQSSFAEFLTGAFGKAVAATDDKRILGYQVDSLSRGATANLALRLKFIEVMAESGEAGTRILGGKAILLQKLGKTKEAMAVTRRVFEGALASSGSSRDPYARQAYYNILRAFKDDHADDLIKIFDEIEAKRGASIELTKERITLLRNLRRPGKPDGVLDVLTKAVVKHPKDTSLREQLASALVSRGQQAKALETRTQTLALNPKDEAQRARLVAAWRQTRHPINALAIRAEGEKLRAKPTTKPTKPADAAVKKKRTPRATIAAVKSFLDSGDLATAQTVFRRLWRQYSQVAANNRYMRVFTPRAHRILWPKDKDEKAKEKQEPKEKPKRYRGGLPEIFTRELKPEEKQRMRWRRGFNMGFPSPGAPASDKEKEEPLTAHAVLAQHEFGRDEIARQLRSLQASQLGTPAARDIYKILISKEVEKAGLEKALAQLLERESTGLCGKIGYGMIAALLDDAPEESSAHLAQSLSGLMKNLNPRDKTQLRRLARLYAKSGKPDHASMLYQWCALLGAGPYGFYNIAYDLLAEVIHTLEGKARVDAVAAILAYSEPSEWGRDYYLRLALETWMELLGPKEALAKSRKLLGDVTKMELQPNRNAGKIAAALHAQNGEVEEAIRCLEIALCKLPAPPKLRYPYYRTYFENPGYMSSLEIARLFPKDMKAFSDPQPWLVQAHASILTWMEKKRLNDTLPLQLLAVIAIRLHEQGETALAQSSLEHLRKLAGDKANDLLWTADVARMIGQTQAADQIERQLFDEGRLHVERVPDVVARVVKANGPEAGLSLGEQAAALTLHPTLLEQLIAAANAADKKDRATHWEKVRVDAEAAKKTLEEQDKKKAEEAKKAREARGR